MHHEPSRSHCSRRWELKPRTISGVFASIVVLCVSSTFADVRLPSVISDNMVLQQSTNAPIWGWAAPGATVRVSGSWSDTIVTATADADGKWLVKLPTPAAGGPYTVTVVSGDTVTLQNVLIGEVWVCSGQSNMEWCINYGIDNGEAEAAAANFPRIRLFDVPHTIATAPADNCEGAWVECDPQTVRGFSAIGYFFGRELHRELNVPIGLIGTNWGGTVAEAWASAETLHQLGEFEDGLAFVQRERDDPGAAAKAAETARQRWWGGIEKYDAGTAEHWETPDFVDSAWATMAMPSLWNGDELDAFDGLLWYRTEVELPADWAGKALTLELGAIDDMDTTYFNGERIDGREGPGFHNVPRKYEVPGDVVRAGRNVIAIRALDTGGPGGFSGKPEEVRLLGPGGAERKLAGQWRFHVGAALAKLPPWPAAIAGLHANLPTVLHNGMLRPLIPFAIRGAIWYQGESNRTRAAQYRKLFPALIADWRRLWEQGDFPFYYVQIAPYGYRFDTGDAAELREAQMMTLATPNTGMVVTMDIGNPADIHPRNKVEVGRRLSLWALSQTYGRDGIIYSGPLYREMTVEGSAIRLFFDHADGSLVAGGGGGDAKLTHFEIAGADGEFVAAEARIDGETVVVSSPTVAAPVAVRYAWGTADEPNLKNAAGLPASSFRTEFGTAPRD